MSESESRDAAARARLEALEQALEERARRAASLEALLRERDAVIAERSAKLRRRNEEYRKAQRQIKTLRAQLERERYTVLRPILRWAYRAARAVVRALPDSWARSVRALARHWRAPGARPPRAAVLSARAAIQSVSGASRPRPEERPGGLPCDVVRAARGTGPDLFVFSGEGGFVAGRDRHGLAAGWAARGCRVFWVCAGPRESGPGAGFEILDQPVPRLFVTRLDLSEGLAALGRAEAADEAAAEANAALDRLRAACGVCASISLVADRRWRLPARAVPGSLLVVDSRDALAGGPSALTPGSGDAEQLIREADLVLSDPQNEARLRPMARALVLIPTGAGADAACDALADALPGLWPRASVIVLTYNQWNLTERCLDSLERRTHYPDSELIVVDNGSSDGTPDRLRSWAEGKPGVRLILNERNLGYAAGNNAGLRVASGQVLVLLNNDTVVTDGWLADLVRHFRHDSGLGLAGPVSNNVPSEARVEVTYDSLADMPGAARVYTRLHARELSEATALSFFCVGISRAAFEKVGYLSEEFGLGWFEDDDYCNRVRQAGFRIGIARDVFIHHHQSAGFSLMPDEKRLALFEHNRAIYERKWGPWVPYRKRAKMTE